MTRKTKKSFVLSLTFLLVTVSLFAVSLFIVQSHGRELEVEYDLIRNQQYIKEQQRITANIVSLSTEDRVLLSSYFLSEREIINFISRVESQAARMNVAVETTQLAVEPANEGGEKILKIGFSFTGTQPAVVRFMEYLEALPYHVAIPRAVIGEANQMINDTRFEGNVLLHITLVP